MTTRTFIISNQHNATGVARIVEKLGDVGEEISVEIKPYKKTRTTDQNKRYWFRLTFIAEEYSRINGEWHDPEVWHVWFKKKILGLDVDVIRGDVILKEKRSCNKSTMQFSEFDNRMEAIAATELDIDWGRFDAWARARKAEMLGEQYAGERSGLYYVRLLQ